MIGDLTPLRSVAAVFCIVLLSGFEARAQVNVTQEHNHPSRNGVYVGRASSIALLKIRGLTEK
jgi:hypothetical protein